MSLEFTPAESMILEEFKINGVTITQYIRQSKVVGENNTYIIQLIKGTPNKPEITLVGQYPTLDYAIEKIETILSNESLIIKPGEFIQVTEKLVRHEISHG